MGVNGCMYWIVVYILINQSFHVINIFDFVNNFVSFVNDFVVNLVNDFVVNLVNDFVDNLVNDFVDNLLDKLNTVYVAVAANMPPTFVFSLFSTKSS